MEPIYDSQEAVCARLRISPSTLMRRLVEFPFPQELGKPNGRWSVSDAALLLWRDWWIYQLSLPIHARQTFQTWVFEVRPQELWRFRPAEPPEVSHIVGRDLSTHHKPTTDPPQTHHRPTKRRQG